MKKIKIILSLLILLQLPEDNALFAQQKESSNKTLENYIKFGLSNNLSLQEKQFNLQKSHLALLEAKSYYLPYISFQSDYSLAKGGRTIDMPLGDLLNNAYATLNQLTASNDFKMVENQKIALMQPEFQDTRIQTVVPLVNYDIKYLNQIKKEAITEKQAEVNIYKRELVRDIQLAYYNYLQAKKFIEIYKNANQLLLDNLKYTEVLISNGLGLKSSLLKVKLQLSKNAALLSEADNKSRAASAYFNFLINRPLESSIVTEPIADTANDLGVISMVPQTTSTREEIGLLQSLIKQSTFMAKKEKTAWLPQVNAFLNAGTQGNNYAISEKNAYITGGAQLKWTLYNGAKTSNKIKQASTDLEILQVKLQETTQKLEVENNTKKLELNSALAKLAASKTNQLLAKEIYRETQLRYRQSQALSIELLEAYTQLINSQLEFELHQTEVLIKQTELERASASYIL